MSYEIRPFSEAEITAIDAGLKFLRALNAIDSEQLFGGDGDNARVKWQYSDNAYGEVQRVIHDMVADIYGPTFAEAFIHECADNGEFAAWNEKVVTYQLLTS